MYMKYDSPLSISKQRSQQSLLLVSNASYVVRLRPRRWRRAYRASTRSRRTSWRTRARVLVALLEGPPSTGHFMCYKSGQMMS